MTISLPSGLFGEVTMTPLLSELVPERLLSLAVIGSSIEEGTTAAILQNNGEFFPKGDRYRKTFTEFCSAVRSTEEGLLRCVACDIQGIALLTGCCPSQANRQLRDIIACHPIQRVVTLAGGVECYKCHCGLLECLKLLSVPEDTSGNVLPIGALWSGQIRTKSHSLDDDAIRLLASEVRYPDPSELLRRYHAIKLVPQDALNDVARHLILLTASVEEPARATFQGKTDQHFLAVAATTVLEMATSLEIIKKTQGQHRLRLQKGLSLGLQCFVKQMNACHSAVLTWPRNVPTDASRLEVLAQASHPTRKHALGTSVRCESEDLEVITNEYEAGNSVCCIEFCTSDGGLLPRLARTLHYEGPMIATAIMVPSLHDNVMWVTVLQPPCQMLTHAGLVRPQAIEFLKTVSDRMAQIIDVVTLLAQQQTIVEKLQIHSKALESQKRQMELLVRNLAHQVSRPIMELKQSAHLLATVGFAKDSYDGFRAALSEIERGARNFDNFEKLTTDVDRRCDGVSVSIPLDLLDLLNISLDRVEPLKVVQRREVVLDVILSAGRSLPKVYASREAGVECLVNVLHNALKYSLGSKPVHVEVSLDDSVTANVRITNVGVEIRANEWEKIYDYAYRADTAKSVSIEGSGIGLYVARAYARMHGGDIIVESCVPTAPTDDGMLRWETTFLLTFSAKE